MKLKRFRGYIFSRPFFGERAPQHIQNIIIREYCEKNNLSYLLSATEYTMDNCFLMLENIVKNLKSVDGIVAYSLFQMPKVKKDRLKIFNKILDQKKEILFSVESIKLSSKKDIVKVEDIWTIKLTLLDCPQELKLK